MNKEELKAYEDALDLIQNEHLNWLNKAGGKRLDLSYFYLEGASFYGARLAKCDFTAARFHGSDFTGADLTTVDFAGARIGRVIDPNGHTLTPMGGER